MTVAGVDDNGKPLAVPPDPARFRACLTRTTTNQEDFDQYWDTWIPAATATRDHWNEDVRHYKLMSEAALESAPEDLHVPPSTEAIMVADYENYYQAWHNMWLLKKEPGNANGILTLCKRRPKDSKAAADAEWELIEDRLYVWGSKYKGQWTLPDGGQAKFGGWSRAGLERWVQLRTECKNARDTAASKTMEQQCLNRLREKHHITEATPALTRAARRNGGNRPPAREEDNMADIDVFD